MKAAPDANCRAMFDRVSAYLDGELPAAECREIERHCKGCDRCAEFIESLRHAVGLCREAGQKPLPADVRDRAKARIRELVGFVSALPVESIPDAPRRRRARPSASPSRRATPRRRRAAAKK